MSGPYRTTGCEPRLHLHTGLAPDRHPTPFSDRLCKFDDDWYCGFASLRQLDAWFSELDFVQLARYNFMLSVYEPSEKDFMASKKQAIFRRGKLKPTFSIALSTRW